MIEGQNQNNSIPGSSSKRKTVSVILFDLRNLAAVLTLLFPLHAAFVESLSILGKQLEHQGKEGPTAARALKHQQLWGSVAHRRVHNHEKQGQDLHLIQLSDLCSWRWQLSPEERTADRPWRPAQRI